MTLREESCSICRDTGWVVSEEAGSPVARRCSCLAKRQVSDLIQRSRLPRRYSDCTFDSYKPQDKSQVDALKLARQFAEQFPGGRTAGLLFIGSCGVGKTHLAAAIINELIKAKRLECVFYDFRDLIRDIQSTFGSGSDVSESDILAPVFGCPLLVLDELGAKRSTDWVEETIFYIINQRYNQNRTTIFTSNYPDAAEKEIEPVPWGRTTPQLKREEALVDRIGHRLLSRIYEMCRLVEISGPDYRRVKQAGYQSNKDL
jgi:DNA replication protein DnaC